jgi:hypothetical protein
MGWASGSSLASALITSAKAHIESGHERKRFYMDMIEAFEEADCDTLGECCGEDDMFDEAMQEIHPDYFEDEEDEEDDYEYKPYP